MKQLKNLKALVLMAGAVMLLGSCVTLHKGPRFPHEPPPPRHPSRHHRAGVNIDRISVPWQENLYAMKKDCLA